METLAITLRRPSTRARTFLSAALLAIMFGVGCAAPMSVKAAKGGDQAALKAAMARDRASGKLDKRRVAEVAKAVAEREIRQSTGADALARIDESRACVGPLADSLEDRGTRGAIR
jgi:hypothetical protein